MVGGSINFYLKAYYIDCLRVYNNNIYLHRCSLIRVYDTIYCILCIQCMTLYNLFTFYLTVCIIVIVTGKIHVIYKIIMMYSRIVSTMSMVEVLAIS